MKNKVADFYRKKYRSEEEVPLDHFLMERDQKKKDDVLESWEGIVENLFDNLKFIDTLKSWPCYRH